MTTNYCILTKDSPDYQSYVNCFYYGIPVDKNSYDAVFVDVGHHNIDLDGYISPKKVLSIFDYLIKQQFTVIQIEIFGLCVNTKYFTHFVEYKIPINESLTYRLVFYLNINDKSIHKHNICLINKNSDSIMIKTIYTEYYKLENDLQHDYGYVSQNCFELGFAVAVNNEYLLEPICKTCHYHSRSIFLPCSIHPTVDHKTLLECNDFKSKITTI